MRQDLRLAPGRQDTQSQVSVLKRIVKTAESPRVALENQLHEMRQGIVHLVFAFAAQQRLAEFVQQVRLLLALLQFRHPQVQRGVRLRQGNFGNLAVRDVAPQPDQSNDPPIRTAQGHFGGQQPDFFAIRQDNRFFGRDHRLAAAENPLLLIEQVAGDIRRVNVKIRLADQIGRFLHAAHAGIGLVGVELLRAQILDINRVGK